MKHTEFFLINKRDNSMMPIVNEGSVDFDDEDDFLEEEASVDLISVIWFETFSVVVEVEEGDHQEEMIYKFL